VAGICAIIVAVSLATVLAQALAALARTPGPPLDARELVVGTNQMEMLLGNSNEPSATPSVSPFSVVS
jgi:hypothetical protein